MNRIQPQLQSDLTTAMKARDETRVAALRMALAALATEQTAGSVARDLTDDEVITVLSREVKKRREAAEAFDKGGRADTAARERAEEAVLAQYLPAALSDDEVAALVQAAVDEAAASGATGPKAMGVVMKSLQPQVKGRADGAAVAARVKAALAGG